MAAHGYCHGDLRQRQYVHPSAQTNSSSMEKRGSVAGYESTSDHVDGDILHELEDGLVPWTSST